MKHSSTQPTFSNTVLPPLHRAAVGNISAVFHGSILDAPAGHAGHAAVPFNFDPPLKNPVTPMMSAEATAFLCLRHYPGRLNAWQTSILLGVNVWDVFILVREGALQPLDGRRGAGLMLACVEILAIKSSDQAMRAVTVILNRHWMAKRG